MNLKLKSSKSSKFKSTKRYRRRKVRENNKNKYGIDKNLNHRVTQKVWRLRMPDTHQQQQKQNQENDKNMHSVTSRRQERQGRHGQQDDDITKVKTLQDATLKASRLYGMMRDFIHPSKINYQKIHSKWRNMKKQIQIGRGGPDDGAEVPVDDKDCVESKSNISLHVTQDPLNPKKFIITRLPGDPIVDGSLTRVAEELMGRLDLDKTKTGTEFEVKPVAPVVVTVPVPVTNSGTDSEIKTVENEANEEDLSSIAHDLIGIILATITPRELTPEDEERHAAAAAIIIALIGLIKKKDDALTKLKRILKDELDKAATDATTGLSAIFKGDQKLINGRTTEVATISGRVTELINKLDNTDPTREEFLEIRRQIRSLREMTTGKIRTYIVQRGGGTNPAFNTSGNTITEAVTAKKPQGQWGPFSGVFTSERSNEDKFESIKYLVDRVSNDSQVLVIFGYGYSGSGKTYTLFGDRARSVNGIAQIALKHYFSNKINVDLKRIIELYNCTYQHKLDKDSSNRAINEFYYGSKTEPKIYNEGVSDLNEIKFNQILTDVETKRKQNGHIFPTHNNPQSSRGHLFVELTVTQGDKPPGHLIFCDMGGRENPNDMWHNNSSYMFCADQKNENPVINGPIVRGNPKTYYPFPVIESTSLKGAEITGMEELTFKSYPTSILKPCNVGKKKITTPHAVTSNSYSTHTGLGTILQATKRWCPQAAFIMKTLREAFYINDSINHLLYHLKYYELHTDKVIDTNWSSGNKTIVYGPSIYVKNPQNMLISNETDPIGMKAILDGYAKLAVNPNKIKYCTFACIRQDEVFKNDSKKTLDFAAQVNSCTDDTISPALKTKTGGAKTRRKRAHGKLQLRTRRTNNNKNNNNIHKNKILKSYTQRRNLRDKKKGHRTRKMK